MSSVYEIVTEKITSLLEKGVIPWHKPWSECAGIHPANAISHRPYHGFNHIWLECVREERGYPLNLWLTYKQASEAGGAVRKGEHGQLVIFWKFNKGEDDKTGKEVTRPMLRYYTVFNVAQCEDTLKFIVPPPPPPVPQSSVYDNMPNKPALRNLGAGAFYRPSEDLVNMPEAVFKGDNEYYSVLYHELSHSTGHSSRLARFASGDTHTFGSADYSKEELIAEMSAAFICAETGTDNDATMINTSAYLQSWLGALKNDKTMIVFAASRAQKSADYILGHTKLDDCGPTPPAPEGEETTPVKKPKTPQIGPVEIGGKEVTSPLGMPQTPATPGSVESQKKNAVVVAPPVTTTWKRRKNKPVKRVKAIAPVTEVVRITPSRRYRRVTLPHHPRTCELAILHHHGERGRSALGWERGRVLAC